MLERAFLFLLLFLAAACGTNANDVVSDSTSRTVINGALVSSQDELARYFVKLINGNSLCSATLIDARFAVTAGHCVKPLLKPLYIGFGPSGEESKQFVTPILYEGYNWYGQGAKNDIALLRLSRPIPTGYGPVILAGLTYATESEYVVAGYGSQISITEFLRTANIPAMPFAISYLRTYDFAFNGYQNVEGGDSGGATFIRRPDGRLVQIGIHSKGDHCTIDRGCQSNFFSDTDVSYFVDWMRSKGANPSVHLRRPRLPEAQWLEQYQQATWDALGREATQEEIDRDRIEGPDYAMRRYQIGEYFEKHPNLLATEWLTAYQTATWNALGREATQGEIDRDKVIRPVMLYNDRVKQIRDYFTAHPNLLVSEWLTAYRTATFHALGRDATQAEIDRDSVVRPVMLYSSRMKLIRNYFASQPNLLVTEWLTAYRTATFRALGRDATPAEIDRDKVVIPIMLYRDRLKALQ